ncbi:MAG: proteasome subunit alpha [Nitrospirales bacterium]|nr:proteasome subunit alpha [Nitrospira sp.]MDR4501661.1 proteasome subunit alpha [Nitrospirales bacterium]
MALPYYVSPEQMMQDKAEYAKKGIAKGRSIIAMEFEQGLVLIADNPSASLFKISEVYDNIAFSGAGKYSEFENLRKAGIQHADLKGLMYSREDVTARSLANGYSQTLGTIFSQELKPFEVELLLAQVGEEAGQDELYRIAFDGSIVDEQRMTAIGGRAEALLSYLRNESPTEPPSLSDALALCKKAFEQMTEQAIADEGLEVAVLDRTRTGRKFRRISSVEVKSLLS